MLGFSPHRCYYYLWKYITPILLLVLMLASFIQMVMTPATYNAWIQEKASKRPGLEKRLQRRGAQRRNVRRLQAGGQQDA